MKSNFQEQGASGYSTGSLTKSMSPRKLFNSVMTGVAFLCGALALIPLVAVLSYLAIQGSRRLNLSVFVERTPTALAQGGGFGNAIIGTMVMVGIAVLIAIPFGILAAIYLTEFSRGKLSRWIRFATNILSGVPSIMAGVFAYGVVVLTFRNLNLGAFSPIAGGVALAVLMLPIIIRTTDEALQLVPKELRQAAFGIGASKFQTVWGVVLPAAVPSIVTGVTLAIARAAGETAPLIFTALFSNFWLQFFPLDKFIQPTASMAVLVYRYATAPYPNQRELAWAASLILVFLVLITSIIARWATRRKVYG